MDRNQSKPLPIFGGLQLNWIEPVLFSSVASKDQFRPVSTDFYYYFYKIITKLITSSCEQVLTTVVLLIERQKKEKRPKKKETSPVLHLLWEWAPYVPWCSSLLVLSYCLCVATCCPCISVCMLLLLPLHCHPHIIILLFVAILLIFVVVHCVLAVVHQPSLHVLSCHGAVCHQHLHCPLRAVACRQGGGAVWCGTCCGPGMRPIATLRAEACSSSVG